MFIIIRLLNYDLSIVGCSFEDDVISACMNVSLVLGVDDNKSTVTGCRKTGHVAFELPVVQLNMLVVDILLSNISMCVVDLLRTSTLPSLYILKVAMLHVVSGVSVSLLSLFVAWFASATSKYSKQIGKFFKRLALFRSSSKLASNYLKFWYVD